MDLSQAFVTSFVPRAIALPKASFIATAPCTRRHHTRSKSPTMRLSSLTVFRRAFLRTAATPQRVAPPAAITASSASFPSPALPASPQLPRLKSTLLRSVTPPLRNTLALAARFAKRMSVLRRRHAKSLRLARMALSLSLACATFVITRTTLNAPTMLATAGVTAPPSLPTIPWRFPTVALPPRLAAVLRPFWESFGVVFLSEFGDKSMFATALMAMKYSPFIVCIGALAALTVMTFIACFLGQLMHYLPATVTHYSSIALFVFFGLQMILQSRSLPNTPGGAGGERADAEEMVAEATMTQVQSSPLAVFAKVSSLIFVAEWCDRSMLATMALAASNNTVAVIGGATFANIICTGFAVCAATLVASKISERMVALTAGILFEVFAVFTYLEGPEG